MLHGFMRCLLVYIVCPGETLPGHHAEMRIRPAFRRLGARFAAIEQNIQTGAKAPQERRMRMTAKPAGVHPSACIVGMVALACVGTCLRQPATSPIWLAVATLGWLGYCKVA
jgi:hypothetical protein